MTTYRRIVLTGASSGIGATLAETLAAPDIHLLLLGRDMDRLSAVAHAAEARGATVATAVAAVEDRARMEEVLLAHDAEAPIDLVIANAGICEGLDGRDAPEAPGLARRVIETNLMGTVNTIEPLLPAMMARKSGRLVLVSSLAGIRPHADLPSYSASKAGVRAYGSALRGFLRQHGVRVTVVSPGFVTSPMSRRHVGFKPFEVSAEKAARIIARGLDRGATEITFPWQLAMLAWLANRLPPEISERFETGFAARIVRD